MTLPTPEEPSYTAIEFTSPAIAELVQTLTTDYGDLDYEKDLHGNFLIIDFPEKGVLTLMRAGDLGGGTFDRIEPAMTARIDLKLVQFITK